MDKVNLLFATRESYNEWLEQKDDWKQTIIDMNVEDVILHLVKTNQAFPVRYLKKPCQRQSDAEYRLQIMGDILSDENLHTSLKKAVDELERLSKYLSEYRQEKNIYQKQYRFLRIVKLYFDILDLLISSLEFSKSGGLQALRNICLSMREDEQRSEMYSLSKHLILEIENILTGIILDIEPQGETFTLKKSASESQTELLKSYIIELLGITIKNKFSIVNPVPFSALEELILNEVIRQNEQIFNEMNLFFNNNTDIIQEITDFTYLHEQLVFYITYVDFIKSCENIPFCKPIFNKDMYKAVNCVSMTLLLKKDRSLVVPNDINLLSGQTFLLSGANQGGKTIYLKSLGLTAYFAKCGCFVSCQSCEIPFYDQIFTHFMQKEIVGKGRLIEETERIHGILSLLTSSSLILLNESFSSTRRQDGVLIALHFIRKFKEIGCSVGFVSHYYEICEKESSIIPLTCVVGSGGERLHKIVQADGGGLAYAHDIALKHGVTYEQMKSVLEKCGNERN